MNQVISRAFSQSAASYSQRLKGKVAIVTASTDGIGYAIAERLGKEGACVVISSRKKTNVEKAVDKLKSQNIKVIGEVCHVSNKEHRYNLFQKTISEFGSLNILVSNAAANPSIGGVLDCEESAWDKIFDTNVKASFMLAKEAVPFLKKNKAGKMIFVSSIAGYQPLPALGAYSVSKTALIGLARAAAVQLAKENIQVNCVAPGIVETRFSTFLTENEEMAKKLLKYVPMGRFGKVHDISGVVAFLASEDADYITGETIVASGGMSSRF